ncbi:SDR family oxidoreductase [Nocardioidaceae bacterium]|nr:SDR family oxidoreductase [Nocardioidaceae bacterium]
MEIQGTVAVVTGAAGGIGAAIAQRLLEHGGSVVVTDLDGARLDASVAALEAYADGRVAGLAGDCSDESHIRASIELAQERFGPVDLYVANAGVGLGQGLEAPDEDWETALGVNVMAHVRAARLLVPGWVERGRGYFLSTASAAGLLTQIGSPTYSVSKHAAVAFAEWLRVTYAHRGVTVSCLCPMGVNTDLLTGGSDSADDNARRSARAVTDAGDVLEPLDVADVVVEALGEERFLVLPHPEVLEFFRRKAGDYDRWLAGMARYQDSLG